MTKGECLILNWPAAAEVPTLPEGEVHVWRAGLDVSPLELERFQNLLDGPERERSERFHGDQDRRRFVAAHVLLRTLLGRYLDAPPERLQFLTGRWGKPALRRGAEMQDIRFSLSHSEHLVFFAFAREREVGVDVECIRSDFDWAPIARRFFSPGEIAALDALPVAARRDGFFSIWTCKEACVKAMGGGFSLSPERLEILWEPDPPCAVTNVRFCGGADGCWTLRSLRGGPDWAAAVAAEGEGWKLNHWGRPPIQAL